MPYSFTRPFALAVSVCLLILPGAALAQEKSGETFPTLKTVQDRVYKNVVVLFADPHGITFRHSRGTAKIPFEHLDEAIQKKYQYDKEAALKFLREHAVVLPAPRVYRIAKNTGSVYQFVPGAFTTFASGVPLTIYGKSFAHAVSAARYVPPSFVHPAPVSSPYNLLLWRQLQLGNHLKLSRACATHSVSGFHTVATRIHRDVQLPRVARRSVPAIGAGWSVPAIGSGMRRGD